MTGHDDMTAAYKAESALGKAPFALDWTEPAREDLRASALVLHQIAVLIAESFAETGHAGKYNKKPAFKKFDKGYVGYYRLAFGELALATVQKPAWRIVFRMNGREIIVVAMGPRKGTAERKGVYETLLERIR